VLPYASLALLRRTSGIPRTVNFTEHLTWMAVRTGQCTAPVANPVHPPTKDYLQASASTVLQISSQSGHALSLEPIPGYMVAGPRSCV
ncbi:hypothetical protein ATANTOWER_009157, partial [Ataeniobius toweri]|nr:hypothetical protein [Ataeniobius toweri]